MPKKQQKWQIIDNDKDQRGLVIFPDYFGGLV